MTILKVNYLFNDKAYEANLLILTANDSVEKMLPEGAVIVKVSEQGAEESGSLTYTLTKTLADKGRFNYVATCDQTGEIILSLNSKREFVACSLNKRPMFFGRLDLVGKGEHGRLIKSYTEELKSGASGDYYKEYLEKLKSIAYLKA